MYDRVNIKSVIIVTSLAAVISVAAGGIGGVPLGTLLIRALLFSLLFAVGTAFVNIIVDTYLPELKISPAVQETPEGEEEDTRGQNVDIVMDDEGGGNPAAYGNSEDGDGSLSGEDEAAAARGSRAPSDDDTEGSVADRPADAEGKELPDIGVFSSLSDEDEEGDAEQEVDSDDVTGTAVPAGSSSRYSAMQTNDEEKIEYFQNNTTAEELAKGVRTMLKSDEKG